MIRVLQSLSCEKYKILLKEPNTKTVSHTDQFSFNSGFTDRMRKIRIPLPPLDEIAEREKIVEEADTDRQLAIETSIVRIMKCRMKLGHQQLISECFEQLSRMFEKFQPDHKAIEEKIESLINREYIERDKENPQLLRYVP